MSGLEAVGVAASILQIADIGMKVSINLCTLYSKIRRADNNLQTLSSEIALTCNVLHQLGELLKYDEKGGLCSQKALFTAQDVLGECRRAFEEIDLAIERCNLGTVPERDSLLDKAVRRIAFVFKEPDLDVLRKNLDRLKSTMLLMLNVIMYAGQVRSKTESSVLQEQQALIASLIQMKTASEIRVKALSDIINSSNSATEGTRDPDGYLFSCSTNDSSSSSATLSDEMWIYCGLIRGILSQVDGCQSGLAKRRYARIREGIWETHVREQFSFNEEIPGQIKHIFGDIFMPGPESTNSYSKSVGREIERPRILPRKRRIGTNPFLSPDEEPSDASKMEALVLEWTVLDEREIEVK